MSYNHFDCGFLIGTESSHVSAALQALLHIPHLRQFLANDVDHQKECKSILDCLSCAFHNLVADASKTFCTVGVVDASFFVNKWKYLSTALNHEKKCDPHEVLFLFITKIRSEVGFRKCTSVEELNSSIVSKLFYTGVSKDVSCNLCGSFSMDVFFPTICIENFSDDLSKDVESALFTEKTDRCLFCIRSEASLKTKEITNFPSIAIIHSEKCSLNFRWKGQLCISNVKYEFLGCIVDDGCNPFYVSLCPDGRMRTFKNSQVSVISHGTFAVSQYLLESRLTLLYVKSKNIAKQVKPQSTEMKYVESRPNSSQRQIMKSDQFQITRYPDLDMVDPEPEVKRKSTQTEVKTYCDASTQYEDVSGKSIRNKKQILSFESCKNNEKFKFFTGLDVDDFEALFNLIGGDDSIKFLKLKYKNTTPTKAIASTLTSKDKLFMLLLRLRRGYPGEEIAFLFGIEKSYAYDICYAMTQLVYLTFKSMEEIMFVSAADQKRNQPKVMRPFQNLRVILDGMSLYIQAPSNFEQQGNMYSRYKSHTVLLFAIGISTHGATVFCSDGYEGNISDKESIMKSGLLNMLQKGDGVMTDRGYDLTAELQAKGCHFFKPPSLGKRKVFTPEEEILTKAIAAARIYVEHAIADIKDWKILQGILPINMISQWSNIVYIVAFLRNFNQNRIHNKSFSCNNPEDVS